MSVLAVAVRVSRLARFGLLLVGVLVVVLLVGAGPAHAYGQVPDWDGGIGRRPSADLLPVNRWSDATGYFHSRLDAQPLGDLMEKAQRNGLAAMGMWVGNFLWSTATSLVEAATRFEVLDSLGGSADRVAADLGTALVSSPVVAALVVATLLTVIWRGMRTSERPWRKLGQVAVTLGVMAVMIAGARSSTSPEGGVYSPGVGSPGWVATTVNDTISAVASAPANAVSLADSGAGFDHSVGVGEPLSCASYVAAMKTAYASSGSLVLDQSASLPLTMSSMWEATGLRAWANAQFGSDNDYTDWVYCRLLEQNRGTPVGPSTSSSTQLGLTVASGGPEPVADAWVWEPTDNNRVDQAMVGWAACRWDGGAWTLARGWTDADDIDARSDCRAWWQGEADAGGLNWTDNRQTVLTRTTDSPAVRDFVLNLHGSENATAIVTVGAYAVSSVFMFAVFGLLSLAIIVAKFMAVVMIVLVFFVAAVALLPGQRDSSKLLAYLKTYSGMALLAFGAQFLFAIITVLTSFMVRAGNELFDRGSLMAMLWVGFAPVAAVAIVHWLFKNVIKAPSPFSVSGAMAWGAAGGVVGGAAGAGLASAVNRARSRGERMARSGARQASRATASKVAQYTGVGPRPRTGRQGMRPAPSGDVRSDRARATRLQDRAPALGGAQTAQGTAGAAPEPEAAATARERAEAVRTERAERAAANRHHRSTNGLRAHVAARPRSAVELRQAIRDRATIAGEEFRRKPIRTALKTAGALAVGAAAVSSGGALGLAAAGGLAVGAYRSSQGKTPFGPDGGWRRSQAARIERWRDHQRNHAPASTAPPQPAEPAHGDGAPRRRVIIEAGPQVGQPAPAPAGMFEGTPGGRA